MLTCHRVIVIIIFILGCSDGSDSALSLKNFQVFDLLILLLGNKKTSKKERITYVIAHSVAFHIAFDAFT